MSQTLRLLSGYESLAVMVEERNDNPLQLVVERGRASRGDLSSSPAPATRRM
jgi:hypothetical protein